MSLSPALDARNAALPEKHRNAWNLLRQHGVTVTGIIRVHGDSIMYRGAAGCPMTAWLYYQGAELLIETEPRFPAMPTTAAMFRERLDRRAPPQGYQPKD